METLPNRSVDPARGYPLYCSRSAWGKVSPTVPLNYHVQGTACWWMQQAMIRCYEYLQEYSGREEQAFITMQIHDELVFDFPASPKRLPEPWRYNLKHVAALKRLMEQGGPDLGLPTPVSCEYHPVHWAEGVSVVC